MISQRVWLYVHQMSSYHPCFGMLFYLCLMYYFLGAPFLWFGVLIFFILFLLIPTYLGLRRNNFFLLRNFSMCMLAPVVRIRIANPYAFYCWIIWLVFFWFLSLFPLVTVTFSFWLNYATYFGRIWADAHQFHLMPWHLSHNFSSSIVLTSIRFIAYNICLPRLYLSLFCTSAHIIRIVFLNSQHTNSNISTNWRI